MTSVDREKAPRHAHYRRLGGEAPGKTPNAPLDITGRCCVPCAIVGHGRAADLLTADGTPVCWAHHEFQALDEEARERVMRAYVEHGTAVGIIALCSEYRAAHPEWMSNLYPAAR